jgi:hypothetical protein
MESCDAKPFIFCLPVYGRISSNALIKRPVEKMHLPSLIVASLLVISPPPPVTRLLKAPPILRAAPWPSPTKEPWTRLSSPNWTSATILESSTTVPQLWQTPSTIFGSEHSLLGHKRLGGRVVALIVAL